MNIPKVLIIILNWNGKEDTLECIHSLQQIQYNNFKIMVIDNGSKDDSVNYLKKTYPNIIYKENNQNYGFAKGNNIGIKYALKNGYDFILLLNNDTIVDKKFLMELITVSISDKNIGILGPMIYDYYEPLKILSSGAKINFITGQAPPIRKIRSNYSNPLKVEYVSGCALLIKKEVIEKIGLLNEKYFCYYEETEWCVKAKKHGYKICVVPKAKIWHKESKSANKINNFKIFLLTRNKILFVKRNANNLTFLFFILFLFILDLPSTMLLYGYGKKNISGLIIYLRGISQGLILMNKNIKSI